jgi:hypothetical protein
MPELRRQAPPFSALDFQTGRKPWELLKVENGWVILSSEHEVMVNNCLIFRQAGPVWLREIDANL